MAINLWTVKFKRDAIYVFTLILISGCAAAPSMQEFEALNKRLSRVEKSRDDSDARVEELESKLKLMREKLDLRDKEDAAIKEDDMAPPEGLKVIRLGKATVSIKVPAAGAGRTVVKSNGLAVKDTPPATGDKGPVKETRQSAAETEGGKGGGKGPATESAKVIYKRAQDLFLSGRYDEARTRFSGLIAAYPDSTLADNAFFWSGEAYYAEKNFSDALDSFSAVVEHYPRGNKAPDALLMMGLCNEKIGESEKAAVLFKRLVKEYSRSGAARIASKRLKALQTQKEGLP